MSVQSAVLQPETVADKPTSSISRDASGDARRLQVRQRRERRIQFLRIAVGVGFLATWEILAQTEIIDVFFFGQPTGIVNQIWKWITRGTATGPLWEQIAVTLEETLLGFFIGVEGKPCPDWHLVEEESIRPRSRYSDNPPVDPPPQDP